ncbi:MAG TPA: hypothetical protein VFI82_15860 [Terriglobales bacterium]|jgi:hypothetical protein|nr:hypothetical protein [Terriglobales bacterium]
MPVLQKSVAALAHKMPKVISPKTHAIADYATIGAFGLLAGILWGRNKRAAISALICGGAELTTTLLTDLPGGMADVISLPAHVKIDFALAAAASALPSFLGFDDGSEAKWFRILGLNITTVAAMTETGSVRRRQVRRRAA